MTTVAPVMDDLAWYLATGAVVAAVLLGGWAFGRYADDVRESMFHAAVLAVVAFAACAVLAPAMTSTTNTDWDAPFERAMGVSDIDVTRPRTWREGSYRHGTRVTGVEHLRSITEVADGERLEATWMRDGVLEQGYIQRDGHRWGLYLDDGDGGYTPLAGTHDKADQNDGKEASDE